MTDTARFCKEEIAKMPTPETVAGWKALEVNADNKAMVEEFAETVKTAHISYNEIAVDEKQLELLGEESAEKLFAIEEDLRQVKKRFNIAVKVQSAECSKESAHKTLYLVGEKFDMTGLLVTLTYDDFSTEDVDGSKLTLKEDKTLTKLDKYVQVIYQDGSNKQTAYVMINVVESLPQPEPPAPPVVEEETDDGMPVGVIIAIVGVAAVGFGVVAFFVVRKIKKSKIAVQTTDENKNE